MYKRSLIFALKIWVVSIIVSPLLVYVWADYYSDPNAVGNVFDFWVLSSIYGLLWSSPYFALFLLANFYFTSRKWTALRKKIGLCLWAAFLILAMIYFLFGFSIPTLKLMVCYTTIAIGGIIFFKLPEKRIDLDLMNRK